MPIEGVSKTRLIDKFISMGMTRKMHLFRNREQAFEVLVVEVYNYKLNLVAQIIFLTIIVVQKL